MAIERAIQELERRRLIVNDDHDKQLRGTSHTTTSKHPGGMGEEKYPTLTAAIMRQKKSDVSSRSSADGAVHAQPRDAREVAATTRKGVVKGARCLGVHGKGSREGNIM